MELGIEEEGVVGLIPDHRIPEYEVVLRRDNDSGERGVQRVEPRVEDRDADAGAVDTLIGEPPDIELAVGHLGRSVRRITRGAAGVEGEGPRRCEDTCGVGARTYAPAAEGLDPLKRRILREEPERPGRTRHAQRVEPAARVPYRRTRGRRPGRRLVERDLGADEQPDVERGIPRPGTGQRRGDRGALGLGGTARQQGAEDQSPDGPDGPDGPGGQAVRSSCPSRTPTIVETPGSCMVTP